MERLEKALKELELTIKNEVRLRDIVKVEIESEVDEIGCINIFAYVYIGSKKVNESNWNDYSITLNDYITFDIENKSKKVDYYASIKLAFMNSIDDSFFGMDAINKAFNLIFTNIKNACIDFEKGR